MAGIDEAGVKDILDQRNHAVVSTVNEDGSIHSTVVWTNVENGKLAVNSAVGRKWPTNLERDPRVTVLVYDESNPYDYVEIRGTARAAPMTQTATSTGSPRSTSASTATRRASQASSASPTRSSPRWSATRSRGRAITVDRIYFLA